MYYTCRVADIRQEGSATAEIARVGGHYHAVQGHSTSLILIDYQSKVRMRLRIRRTILTYIPSRTVFQLSRSIYQLIAYRTSVNALVLGNFFEYRRK